MPISSYSPVTGWSMADPSTVNSYAFANPNAIGPSPLAPNFMGGSTDPSVYGTNPYIKNLNQNIYAWQANQGQAPGFTQAQFDTNWGNFMMPGAGFNPGGFNQAMGTGTPTTGPGSSAGTGWNATNFFLNPDGSVGTASGTPPTQPATATGNAFPQGGTTPGGGGVNTPTVYPPTGLGTAVNPGGSGNPYATPGGAGGPPVGTPADASARYAAAQQQLGPPPNAYSDPAGYQAYMSKLNSIIGYNPATGQWGSGTAGGPGGGPPNFLTPPSQTTSPVNPTQGPVAGSSPDAALAGLPNDISYLRNIAQSGLPVNATPAWQAMIDAQSRQNQENAANLAEQFNTSGNRFGTAFGTSMTDYWNQVGLNQNSLLGQMTFQSQSDAANRMLSAGTTLGGYGSNALSQLSSQGFQSNMAQNQAQLQAALAMMGYGAGAAGQIANISAGATNQLNQNAFGAGTQMYGAETQSALAEAQRQMQLQSLGLGTASTLDQGWMQNLMLGNQLGTSQYGIDQQQIQNQYQEFLRTQPQYNPLLSMMYSGATGYPELSYPSYQPGQLGGLLGGAGQFMGGLPPGFWSMLGL